MAELNKITPKKLLWVDLEMTGLDPAKDRIVEVAAIMTDWNFAELGAFESGVKQDPKLVEAFAWLADKPELKKAMLELATNSPDEQVVRDNVMAFINQHVAADEVALLAGNSIHQDRRFIQQWWPEVNARLHYRMLDVSAWKVVMLGKYGLEFPKKETHRALDDIRESIDELKFYLGKFKL